MSLEIHGFIFLLAAINGLVFAFISFVKGARDKHYLYTGLLLIVLTIMFFDEFGRWTPEFFTNYPQFTFVFTFAWFLLLPIIFMWVRFAESKVYVRWHDLFHLVPLLVINMIDNQFLLETSVRELTLLSNQESPEAHNGKIIFSTQILIYLIWIYWLLKQKYKYAGWQLFIRLSPWLKSLAVLFAVYFVIVWGFIFIYEFTDIYLKKMDIWKTNLFLIVLYGWLFIAVFDPSSLKLSVRSIRVWQEKFDFDKLSVELKNVIEKINESRSYLNADFGPVELAIEIGVSGRQLSGMVKNELDITVPQLLAILRIKEMEKRFKKDESHKLSIEGLAKSVGFRSKTSFYRLFKEFTGETPSIYFRKLGL